MLETKSSLLGKRIAILATDGFEESELFEPMTALKEAGAITEIISLQDGDIQGFREFERGKAIKVDKPIGAASVSDYSALLLPGGTINADKLRAEPQVKAFVRQFFELSKPVAALCHAPWLLIDANVIEGRTVTSYSAIQRDLENANAIWIDREVVVDGGLVTSRDPNDIPAFNAKMIEVFSEG